MKYLLTSSKYPKDSEYLQLNDTLAQKVREVLPTTTRQMMTGVIVTIGLFVEIGTIEDLKILQMLAGDTLIVDSIGYWFNNTPSIEIYNGYRE